MSTASPQYLSGLSVGDCLTHLEKPPKQSKNSFNSLTQREIIYSFQTPPYHNSVCQLLTMLERKKSPTGEADRVTQRAVTVIGTLK